MDDVFVRLRNDMPDAIPGATILDENGDYNMYLNAHFSREYLLRVYRHELCHIKRGHFYDDAMSLSEKETEANTAEGDENYGKSRT